MSSMLFRPWNNCWCRKRKLFCHTTSIITRMTVFFYNFLTKYFIIRSSCPTNGKVLMTFTTTKSLSSSRKLTVFLHTTSMAKEAINKTFYHFFFSETVNLFFKPNLWSSASLRQNAMVMKTIMRPSTTNSTVSLPPVSWWSSKPIRRGIICNNTICATRISVEIEKNFPTDWAVSSLSFDHLWIHHQFMIAKIMIPSKWIPWSTPS